MYKVMFVYFTLLDVENMVVYLLTSLDFLCSTRYNLYSVCLFESTIYLDFVITISRIQAVLETRILRFSLWEHSLDHLVHFVSATLSLEESEIGMEKALQNSNILPTKIRINPANSIHF